MSNYKLVPTRDDLIQCLLATRGQSEGVTADAILSMLAATTVVQGEPVAEPRKKDSVLFHLAEILRKVQGRTCDETGDELDVGYECMRIRDLCKAAPPAPDVSALVEALERINRMDSMSYYSLESAKIVARAALDAYRKRG